MESKQTQLYKFYRGDSNVYNLGRDIYFYNNNVLQDNMRKPNIYFNSIDPAYIKCGNFCSNCSNIPQMNDIINKINCQRCKECMTPAPRIYLKPKPQRKYPRYPKSPPSIPTPFPYLKGSHNEIPRVIPLKEDVKEFRLNAVSTSDINCNDYCGENVCNDWRNQMNLYEECQLTNNQTECRRRFGCKQWEGNYRYRLTPPIHPHLTDCEPCWHNNYTNI